MLWCVKAILFDLDGTLVDSIPLWIEANLRALAARHCIMDKRTFLTEVYQRGFHYHGILEHCGLRTQDAEKFYRERNNFFDELLREKVEWMGKAEQTLQACAAIMPLGLMTGSARRFIDAMDARLHLSKIFRAIVTYDDTGLQMKPDPYGLFLLAKKLKVQAAACAYVGDQLVDVQAARAAGMTSVLIPTKDTPQGAAKEADVVLKNTEDVTDIVKNRSSAS